MEATEKVGSMSATSRIPLVLLGWLLSVVLAVYGGMATYSGGRQATYGLLSYTWPKVPGHITVSSVYHRGRVLKMNIAYDYCLGEACYTSKALDFRGVKFTSNPVYAWGARYQYPYGRRLLVSYDPSHPARAVVEPGLKWVYLLNIQLGVLMMLLGLLTGYWVSNQTAQFLLGRPQFKA